MSRTILYIYMLCLVLSGCGLLGSNEDTFQITGKVVFTVLDESGKRQIFSINANGTVLRQLSEVGDHEDFHPAWSPDGSEIVFSTTLQSTTNGPSLYLMDADGDNMRPMKKEANSPTPTAGYNPSWSPDGTKIAFNFCTDCEQSATQEIFIYDIEADTVIQLTENQSNDIQPIWSPDGSRIAFLTDRDYGSETRNDLYVMNVNGSNVEKFTQAGYVNNPAWSPTGNTVAYEGGMQLNEVYLLDVSSKQISLFESGFDQTVNPQWDSLGTKLLILGGDEGQAPRTLRLFELESGNPKALDTVVLGGRSVGSDYNWIMLARE